MPEFISRPNLPEGLAALVAQLRAKQNDPIAAGIAQFGQQIGGAVGDHFDAKRKSDAQVKSILAGLMQEGLVTPNSTADIPGILSGKIPMPIGAPKPKGASDITITAEMLTNFPQFAKMGFTEGNRIPVSVFNASAAPAKENKTLVEVTPELAKKYKGLIVGSLVPATHMSTLEQKETAAAAKTEKASEKQLASEMAATKQATRIIGTIDAALKKVGATSAGMGATLSAVPGSKAKDLAATLTTIKANLGFAELQAMRQASPTGGALGQVAVQELEALQATVASLDQKQSEDQLKGNLMKVKSHYQNWLDAVNESKKEAAPFASSGNGLAPAAAKTPAPPQTAESIRAAFKAGEITREQAKAQISALGGFNGR